MGFGISGRKKNSVAGQKWLSQVFAQLDLFSLFPVESLGHAHQIGK
jgi:hypothetical protein